MKNCKIFFFSCCVLFLSFGYGQEYVGINNDTPARNLDMQGSGSQFLRLQSTTVSPSESGLELVRGTQIMNARDWKITNYSEGLRIATATDNFTTVSYTKLLFNHSGYLGIGTIDPEAQLHIATGTAATNENDGYMILGNKGAYNLVFDNNGLIGRYNGSAAAVYIQGTGGNTIFGSISSPTHTLLPNGTLVVGGGVSNALMNVRSDDQFQIQLRNEETGTNRWFIGASNENWSVGNNYLVFTPSLSSADAALRLYDTDENNGSHAPVEIRSSASQTLLMDGNEIDGLSGPLYFNNNSDNDTYLNPTGGRVGIGTTTPLSQVHVKTTNFALNLQRGSVTWRFGPAASGELLVANNNANGVVAMIAGNGDWVPLSDSTKKQSILPLENAMEKINAIPLHTYNYKDDTNKRRDFGVIAQELEKVVPEAVFQNEGQYGVTYDQLTALVIKGIQEQQQEIEELLEMCSTIADKLSQDITASDKN